MHEILSFCLTPSLLILGLGYEKFVCVEAAAAMKPVEVAPGQAWSADMDLIPSAL